MKKLTKLQVEAYLMTALIDNHEMLLTATLECTDEQATTLLEKYWEFERAFNLLISPNMTDTRSKCPC